MLFKNISILDENLQIQEDINVHVEDGKIKYIGRDDTLNTHFDETYDGKGCLLMSGFFNAHAHSPMTLLRGYGENLPLQRWLKERIFPFEAGLDSNAVYWGTLLGIAEGFRNGIVSSSDMYYFCEDIVRANVEAGSKVNVARAVTNFSDEEVLNHKGFANACKIYEEYHGIEDASILVDMSVHAEYTSTPALVKKVVEYAQKVNTGIHIHLSETQKEHDECKQRHGGMTPTQYFDSLGVFDSRSIAAHGVWLEENDLNILSKSNAHIVNCPVSNMKLASGICNTAKLMKKGVNFALGTDSVASNNSLNFFEEMKFSSLGVKVQNLDPTLIDSKQVLEAATKNGAKSQGRNDTGILKEGNRADLIVIDIDTVNMKPMHDLHANLVYSAGSDNVLMTMINGEVVYRDGVYLTIDVERAMREVEIASDKIKSII